MPGAGLYIKVNLVSSSMIWPSGCIHFIGKEAVLGHHYGLEPGSGPNTDVNWHSWSNKLQTYAHIGIIMSQGSLLLVYISRGVGNLTPAAH